MNKYYTYGCKILAFNSPLKGRTLPNFVKIWRGQVELFTFMC
jgi:hypothetical protein